MAEQIQQKTVNSFVKGLVTEASPLTFPENASVDELNMSLDKSGVRKRRPGIERETNSSLGNFLIGQGALVHTETWKNVSNIGGTEFLVLQHGRFLRFYDKSGVPVSAGLKSFFVNLDDFSAGNTIDRAQARIDVTTIDGNLVVVSDAVEPFSIEYDPDNDTISTSAITPRVRDFEWQGNTEGYYQGIPKDEVADERQYDTFNSGWVLRSAQAGVLEKWTGEKKTFPPLTKPWYVGKVPNDTVKSGQGWEPNAWLILEGGNSLSGNGHFILNLFRKDRAQAIKDAPAERTGSNRTLDIPVEVESSRFTTVSTFAGRVWFSGLSSKKNSSKVYFSRIVQNLQDIGKFFQEGDPTSEHDPDLVDSDGGVISIPQASKIKALTPFGDKLLVFAENGVWEIGGIDGVFKATEFFVRQVTGADGLSNRATLVIAEGTPVWWSPNGIFMITSEQISGQAVGKNISEGTIQTFWENIGQLQRSMATGIFDDINKQIYWLYGDDSNIDFKYNGVLILDLVLQAFFPWRFEDQDSNTDYVIGASFFSGLGEQDTTFNVIDSNDDNVIAGTDNVVATITQPKVDGPTEIRFIIRDGTEFKPTFTTITNRDFKDWGSVDFDSFAEAAYDFGGDLTRRKNNILVTTYFNLTETGFVDEGGGSYSFQNPSSCLLQAFWDLQRSNSSSQQVYRHLRPIVVDENDLNSFDYPFNDIVTRNKIRGRGRVLKLRFESEASKDFQLQGYEVINAAPRSV